MMMAAGADSPSTVATQSAKTDILQKIGQGGNNHQTNLELAELHEEDLSEDGKEEKPENNVETRRSETTTPAHQQLAATAAASALEDQSDADLRNKIDLLQLTLLKVKCETEAEIRRLCREVEEKNEILRQLRRQLEEQGDYKELQQQARVMQSPPKIEDIPPKSNLVPDIYALQQMKALQAANPALKALVDARASMLPWLRPPSFMQPPPPTNHSDDMAKLWRQSILAAANKPPGGELGNLTNKNANESLTRSSTPNTNEPCSPPPTLMPPPYQHLSNEPRKSMFSGPGGRIPKSDPMEGQLQDMLHYNMERCAGQALDTHQTSRRVRELLSSHNIGQRLFAKYVLGLSQGTVSELLSKPKMWEKLTEKGRDSYRKMHAWAYDENAVLLLKSLIPRKGELMRSASSPRSLAQIQRDKSRQMRSPSHQPPTPPSMVPAPKVDFLAMHQERLAFEAAHHDQRERDSESPQDLSRDTLLDKESFNEEDSKSEASPPSTPQSASGSNRPPPPLIPFTTKTPGNPLQQMVSITNSLTALPPPPLASPTSALSFRSNGGANSASSAAAARVAGNKMALPPISQEQFDKYSHINTELLVRKVKECLSQNSISQRLFGECVLGLSQGSVSDLLTRPKPWHMLTQKGKEPFIRMQMFADDPDAVKRLMASQYRIAPERLMRSGNFPTPTFPFYPMGLTSPVKVPKTSPSSHFLGGQSAMSRLFPEPLNERNFPPMFQDFLLRPLQPPIFNAPTMQDLPQELDTLSITTKVKEKLATHNLGQKVFGEAVLGLSQGSVSEYLCKPKPWSMLSMKGREPYIKMQLWLEDPAGVDKLRLFENGASDLRKRRNSSNCPSPSESPPPMEKKAKIELDPTKALSQPFDLFRMWYQHQQQQQQQQQLQQENEDSKSDSSGGEKTRRKSSTPQQYLGSQVDESND